jgi:hypothetical protein
MFICKQFQRCSGEFNFWSTNPVENLRKNYQDFRKKDSIEAGPSKEYVSSGNVKKNTRKSMLSM